MSFKLRLLQLGFTCSTAAVKLRSIQFASVQSKFSSFFFFFWLFLLQKAEMC